MIYFDNAATSFPKPKCVVDELYRCVCSYCGNPGRSSHRLSRMSDEVIYEARERISSHFSLNCPERVVFTYNATYALNMAIKTTVTSKTHILISDVEHNSVVRPLERLRETLGIEYSLFSSSDPIPSIEAAIRPDTSGIVSTLASNVTGIPIDVEALSQVAKKHGLFLILDASQAAGHFKIDLSDKYFTALCAPGHKGLFGIQGSGFAIFSSDKRRDSFIEGGSGSDSKSPHMPILLPEGYEGGTLATPAIATLLEGVKFIDGIGIDTISSRIKNLTQQLRERLSDIESVILYPSANGIISFNVSGVKSSSVASRLDKVGICTRAGLHCAPLAHNKIGTSEFGSVRASLSFFNTEKEIDTFCDVVKREFSKI